MSEARYKRTRSAFPIGPPLLTEAEDRVQTPSSCVFLSSESLSRPSLPWYHRILRPLDLISDCAPLEESFYVLILRDESSLCPPVALWTTPACWVATRKVLL